MQLTTDQAEVVTTISTLFTAARTDEIAKFDTVIAPGFYMNKGGVRFDGNSIMNPIKAMHVGGKRYEWNVTQPDVHINGNSAWIAYVNKGSITDASGTQKQEWLESAFLERQEASLSIHHSCAGCKEAPIPLELVSQIPE